MIIPDPNQNYIISWTVSNVPATVSVSSQMINGGNLISNGGYTHVVGEEFITPSLFDEVEAKMAGKTNPPKLQEKHITDIRSVLALIYNTFQSRSNCLHCFFTIGSDEDKICFHYMNSLPIIRFSLFKDGSSTIVFASDWNGTPRVYEGWDAIPNNEQESLEIQKKAVSYKAKSVFVIKDAKKINLYDWGFEIINDGGIQLTAILGYALTEKSEHIVGKTSYVHPFNPKVSSSPDFMKLVASWSKDQDAK